MLNEGPIGHDKRVLPTIERAISDFRKGVKYLDGEVHFLDIPYEGKTKLPGYLYLPPESKRLPGGQKTPILINTGGGDSTQEEIYFINVSTGRSLGYAVLTFDGPGQGIVLRRDQLPMRPDWEVVVGCVLDHLWDFARDHPEANLDLDHIGITGASMGGGGVLRAARSAGQANQGVHQRGWLLLHGELRTGTYAGVAVAAVQQRLYQRRALRHHHRRHFRVDVPDTLGVQPHALGDGAIERCAGHPHDAGRRRS